MSELIDGRKLAKAREEKLAAKVKSLNLTPKVISLVIGADPASHLYTNMKKKKAADVGIEFEPKYFSEETPFEEIANVIQKLNSDPEINGIMVQLPMPEKFLNGRHELELLNLIDKKKDIDGLTENPIFMPATAVAVISIIDDEKVKVKGVKITVLGRSLLVGKPVADELNRRGGLVSVVHSKTENPKEIVLGADLVISAVGKAHLVPGDWIKEGAVVIDVGTSPLDGKIVGDVDFESAQDKASKITPVPGGVGPMTVISLMENVARAANVSVTA